MHNNNNHNHYRYRHRVGNSLKKCIANPYFLIKELKKSSDLRANWVALAFFEFRLYIIQNDEYLFIYLEKYNEKLSNCVNVMSNDTTKYHKVTCLILLLIFAWQLLPTLSFNI